MDTRLDCDINVSSGTVGTTRWASSTEPGPASNFSTSIDDPTAFINRTSTARFLVTEQVVFQPNDKFVIMPIFIYQRTKDRDPQHGWNQWVSFGARPEVFINKW